MTTNIIIYTVVAAFAMAGSAVADQPKLPPRPTPTKEFKARAIMPDTPHDRQCDFPEPVDMAPECERLGETP